MWALCVLLCFDLVQTQPIITPKKTNYDDITARQLLNLAASIYGDEHEKCLKRTFPASQSYYVISRTEVTCDGGDNTCAGLIGAGEERKHLRFTPRRIKLLL
ncbi:hypothetical protein KIN20_034695 [Parelaphostrongylus tenuis]|uniref:Secreted protein n=1 Tax=Parelaphostrongylus tenuis TaxID=148309 RepID=A0AAD5RAE2_PARTN|nr:hypothetical protein KIN20_034695 [Parelaphostrongylus tenuis]